MVRLAALIAVASRAQMLAIPVATTMRSVPASSMLARTNGSRPPGASPNQNAPKPSASISPTSVEIDVRRRAIATDPHADPSEPRAESRVGPLVSAGVDHV